MEKAYLVLSTGDVFEGYSFGADAECTGEVVFTTGMGGYIETLADPAYYGQIIMQTFPMIGNYGIIREDFAGKVQAKGYIVREYCQAPSNFRCDLDIDAFLKEMNIPGLCGVDTREITRVLREEGVMNGRICKEIPSDLSEIKNYRIVNAVASVCCGEEETFAAEGEEKYKVTLVNYGDKNSIVRNLTKRGCKVRTLPYNASAEQILEGTPDGVVLSGGPGAPEDNTAAVEEIKKIKGKVPLFAIGLGHQLLALANGGKTVKLKYGHRGANQPVKDMQGTRTYITSQNHGYAVVSESLQKPATVRFVNLNDNTCEGIDYPDSHAFSVQFDPCTDSENFLFDRFISYMGGNF